MFKVKSIIASLLLVTLLVGCGGVTMGSDEDRLSKEEAEQELSALLKKVKVSIVQNPVMDIYDVADDDAIVLADINTFPIVVEGTGSINIEIAAATELTSKAPDDWLCVVAKNFNRSGAEVNGKLVSVSIRQITSGEIVTYVNADEYKPNAIIPSNAAWGSMIESTGIGITKVADRIAGNTAGILMSPESYSNFIDKYKEITVSNVLEAANAGDITFAYTNPYTSSTGLNMLTAMLSAFDSKNPLSADACKALLEYQKNSPPVAYTTSVLSAQAAKGLVDTMVMEEQAYINSTELQKYHYEPFGIRHDHPVYSFDWDSEDEKAVLDLFVEYCQNTESQKLATERGFNRHDDYVGVDTGLTGTGYLMAQSVWKENKNGGRPVVAVFVTDVSGSMRGEPLNSLQTSLTAVSKYIGSEHYIGLVSYSDDVVINLPIEQFDDKQRAKFSGEVKNLMAESATHTYEAVLVGLDMLNKKMAEIGDATPIMFVLTDGEANGGYTLRRVLPVVGGLGVPIYTIAYNYNNMGDLEALSNINEAASVRADSDDIVNQLRNLFNTQL